MKKIFCFGELLIRLSPSTEADWLNKPMPFFIGGAELNVAHALASWGEAVKYGSAIPDNYLSHQITQNLLKEGIDISAILFQGERIGLYYLPQGADMKQAGVIYDRAGSSFAQLKPGTIDWEEVLSDADWFHFSAICPALGENPAAVCLEALKAARKKNVPVSIDLNYRQKLWKSRDPLSIMPELAGYCHVVMGNIWSAHSLLGIPLDTDIGASWNRKEFLAHAEATSREIIRRFPHCGTVANTFRFNLSDSDALYYASLNHGGSDYHSKEWKAEGIEDRVGTGDCFMAGLIYGIRNQRPAQDIVEYAASAAFGKFYEKGDRSRQTPAIIQKRIKEHG